MRSILGSLVHLLFVVVSIGAPFVSANATDVPATSPASMPSTAPAAISWEQASDHVDEDVIVTGPVIGFHDFGGAVVLNVGKDYPDAKRFTVYISADNRKEMPKDLDKGKTIAVTGKVKIFHKVPEIEGDAAHISVVDAGTTTAATRP